MTMVLCLFAVTLFLAYSNGANDNFKGVATLYGSGTASYRTALAIGTVATFLGCLASVFLAETLLKAFSGKGLIPDAIAASPNFLTAVAAGAGVTVILATRLGFPISTTHALTGALAGAGLIMAGPQLNLSALGTAFFLPLLVSPVLAVVLTMPLYKLAHYVVGVLGLQRQSCVCVSPGQFVPAPGLIFDGSGAAFASSRPALVAPHISVGTAPACVSKYSGNVFGITAQSLVDSLHYFSAAAVSFARGLNDTPKMAGLLLAIKAFDIKISMLAIASTMALGGILHAHRVAETMSKKISKMNDGQALTANLVTACLVIGASRFGLPVSTTHVSVGAITGVGIVNGSADRSVISSILMSWLLTLPVAALIAGLAALLLTQYS
jgi:inorganic phosphate transporter, PiT family